MPFFYYDPTMIILIPALLLASYASLKVNLTYKKYAKVASKSGYTGQEVARKILDMNGLGNVEIGRVSGNLSDHYDPRSKKINLSTDVYDSASIAAISVAAHECGHAIQDAKGYAPLKIRHLIYPLASFGSNIGFILILAGIFLGAIGWAQIGVVLFSATVAFQLVTLPVEFNASSRALDILQDTGMAVGPDIKGSKKMLSAAAFTYVASALVAILQLVRLIMIVGLGNND